MVHIRLPKNSVVTEGTHYPLDDKSMKTTIRIVQIYRYDPDTDENPRYDSFEINAEKCGPMVLDALLHIKDANDTNEYYKRIW